MKKVNPIRVLTSLILIAIVSTFFSWAFTGDSGEYAAPIATTLLVAGFKFAGVHFDSLFRSVVKIVTAATVAAPVLLPVFIPVSVPTCLTVLLRFFY
jgi:hypothetical protein